MGQEARLRAGRGLPLFWRVCLVNGAVLAVGTAVLAASPATVSTPVLAREALVLAVGLTVILVANGLLLRAMLGPLDRLRRLMEDVDLLRPGQRLPEQGSGPAAELITSFNAMLERLEAERAASSGQALAAQEAERRRVAQELHDEVGQSLTAVLLGLRRVADRAPADLQQEVLLVQETARASLDEVRQVVRRLRPGVLDDLGLVSALTSLVTEHTRLTGADVCRRLSSDLPALGPDAELVVYRVAQEALTNVARHAAAGRVCVDLTPTFTGDAVQLRVVDDGRGLGDSHEGAGIRGMRERAMLIAATLTVGPHPEGGTELRLLVPVPRTGERR
ncbi:two-component system, NarL family, sensor histidine kinase UhpB [Geodermatophilus obscurus]|uniref:histidine kinase n=1 Tax=Geodermatophilus obscurus TaxID=1861 RepID=A0A1M7ULQ6_9ACTN|nr:HAMP domain-containing sensor histidine kinase [Geodermatophilus obscurus]SHN83880.1 two-component system, NarL family, sensor histidine kinase UhpB [Geodermatophilus obscurus]